jgi:hypothetical protein
MTNVIEMTISTPDGGKIQRLMEPIDVINHSEAEASLILTALEGPLGTKVTFEVIG